MFKHFLLILVFIFHSTSLLAKPHFVGYFEAKPDFGGAVNLMCIEQIHNNYLNVTIVTTYCNNKECMSPRSDELWFQSQLNKKHIIYRERNCSLKVLFTEFGAKITHSASCRDDDHPYLYANGSYKYIEPEFDKERCGY